MWRSMTNEPNKPNCPLKSDTIPKHSMYGIFTYIGVVLGVNVCKYAIHGVSGIYFDNLG